MYIETCNTQFSFLKLKQSERLERRFRTLCSEIKSNYKLKYQGGQKRQEFDKRLHNIVVLRN